MSDLLSEAMEIARNHRTSSLDPSGHPTRIVGPDVCESCGDVLTERDIVLYSLAVGNSREFYCRECSDVVMAIRRSWEREDESK